MNLSWSEQEACDDISPDSGPAQPQKVSPANHARQTRQPNQNGCPIEERVTPKEEVPDFVVACVLSPVVIFSEPLY
jgi:hypothetical protein